VKSPEARMLTQHKEKHSSTSLPAQGDRNWHSDLSEVFLNFTATKGVMHFPNSSCLNAATFQQRMQNTLCHALAKQNPWSSTHISDFSPD